MAQELLLGLLEVSKTPELGVYSFQGSNATISAFENILDDRYL